MNRLKKGVKTVSRHVFIEVYHFFPSVECRGGGEKCFQALASLDHRLLGREQLGEVFALDMLPPLKTGDG